MAYYFGQQYILTQTADESKGRKAKAVYVEWEGTYLYVSDNGIINDTGCCEKVNNAWVAIDGIPFNPHVKRYSFAYTHSWFHYCHIIYKDYYSNDGKCKPVLVIPGNGNFEVFDFDAETVTSYADPSTMAYFVYTPIVKFENHRLKMYQICGGMLANLATSKIVLWDITTGTPRFVKSEPTSDTRNWVNQPQLRIGTIPATAITIRNPVWHGDENAVIASSVNCNTGGYNGGQIAMCRYIVWYSTIVNQFKNLIYESGIFQYLDTLHGLKKIPTYDTERGIVQPGNWGQGSFINIDVGTSTYLILGPGEIESEYIMLVKFKTYTWNDLYNGDLHGDGSGTNQFWDDIPPELSFFSMSMVLRWGLYATYKLSPTLFAYSYGLPNGANALKLITFDPETGTLDDDRTLSFSSTGYGFPGSLGYGPIE
jgi:hypothetical protein